MNTHTWADGYGLWHARVADTPDAAKVAKRAILAELRQRVDHVDARRIRVRLVDMDNGTEHYVEVAS